MGGGTAKTSTHDMRNGAPWLGIVYALGFCAYLFNGVWNAYLQEYTLLYYVLDAAIRVVFPALSLLLLLNQGASRDELGLSDLFSVRDVRLTLVACTALALPYSLICFNIPFSEPIIASHPAVPRTPIGALLYSLYFAASASLPEEFLFRAIAFRYFGRSTFLISSCVLFGLTHWEGGFTLIATTSVFGLASGLFYWKTQRLLPLIFAHFMADFSLVYLLPMLAAMAGLSHSFT